LTAASLRKVARIDPAPIYVYYAKALSLAIGTPPLCKPLDKDT